MYVIDFPKLYILSSFLLFNCQLRRNLAIYKDLILLEPHSDKNKAMIVIPGINRDELQKEIFRFDIIAYKDDNITWATPSSALIVIRDLNNNAPEITIEPFANDETVFIDIPENTFLTLPFDKIIVHDLDLEKHATYAVSLTHEGPINYSKPFNIIPGNGYQRSEFFKIDVYQNAASLDYEDDAWKTFEIIMFAKETDTEEKNERTKNIRINLINWNDELPIFTEGGDYRFEIFEDIAVDKQIGIVEAIDLDEDDKVEYTILGNIANILRITQDPDGKGIITTKDNNIFDYERQTEVVLQIEAKDTLQIFEEELHKVYAQVTIIIQDVNDETPELRMPTKTPETYENVAANTLITDLIIAFDPDTDANLQFKINWDESSATKYGQTVDKIFYKNCFIIEKHSESINLVHGLLMVNPEFVVNLEIDYEKFDILYLTIEVDDLAQVIGDGKASAQLTVRINDENDNSPEFMAGTLTTVRNVTEEARSDTQIGTIVATDDDGPQYNNISYSIRADDSSIEDWIEIDQTGVLRVKEDRKIDCDDPPRQFIEYTIKISDGKHENEGKIKINIIDTNNKVPEFSDFKKEVDIKENAKSGYEITTVKATDADRDFDHRNLQFQIDPTYDKSGNYFEINRITGVLLVKLNGLAEFNYDTGDKIYDIPIEVYDSITNIANRDITIVKVSLTDVNNHAPEFIGIYNPTVVENVELHTPLEEICARDLDSGENGRVSFTLDSIEPESGVTEPAPSEMLFRIEDSSENCIRLFVDSSLKNYYGIWKLTITAHDNGYEDVDYGSQSTEGIFYVEITPFNYNAPQIVYPTSENLRLSNNQEINQVLQDVNRENLRSFEAFDPDGGIYGHVVFKILPTSGQADDTNYFEFQQVDDKKANLRLKQPHNTKSVYYITCIAYDGDDKASAPVNLKIIFVDVDGHPRFEYLEDFAFFKELDAGLDSNPYVIPEGWDPMNEGLPEGEYQDVYYFLLEPSQYFELDHKNRELTLVKSLDKTQQEKHILKIVLSRDDTNMPRERPEDSILTLTILVLDDDAPAIDPGGQSNKPTIFYPVTSSLRLLSDQPVNYNVVDVNSAVLRAFEAFGRNMDGSPSEILFKIANVLGQTEDKDYFKIIKLTTDKTSSYLQLALEPDHPNPYYIRVTAEDSLNQVSDSVDLKITFVDMSGSPYFNDINTEDLVFIRENQIGLLNDFYDIPAAIEPRNEGIENSLELMPLYYFIDSTYNTADAAFFKIDSNKLLLQTELDREKKQRHEIRIIVSRNPIGPAANPPTNSLLILTVMVQDVNDNPPVFEIENYGAGITTTDYLGKIVLTVKALDLDLNETITYHINQDTFRAYGENIETVAVNSFTMTTNTELNIGNIGLNFVPRSTMSGYFEFEIEAKDNDAIHKDNALVKIYLISDTNRVTFVFLNTVNEFEFEDNIQFMLELFTDKFGYKCEINDYEPASDTNGSPIPTLTNVRVHFVKDDEAIPAATILSLASDTVFITQLKSLLAQRQLILQEIPNIDIDEQTSKAELLQTILIVLSVVLGILCAILIVAFFIRTRNLRRQLKALSTVDFGSTSSNLNRREAPTTNVFSVEGSNPVLNNNNLPPVFDNISVQSDESDFAGIHNDPTFKSRKESINPELIEEMRRKSVNPMSNGKSNGFDSNL